VRSSTRSTVPVLLLAETIAETAETVIAEITAEMIAAATAAIAETATAAASVASAVKELLEKEARNNHVNA
jgi:hypothetical protein